MHKKYGKFYVSFIGVLEDCEIQFKQKSLTWNLYNTDVIIFRRRAKSQINSKTITEK